MSKKVLGKGLEALIPEKEKREELIYLSMEKIVPSSLQPRQEIDSRELEELKNSIKEKGILQPILVRRKENRYEIIAGHRRYFAAKSLGIKELPTIIKELSDKEALAFALVENLQRKDLNPIEEATSFKRLHEEFNLTYEEIARLVNKDKTYIANALRLLNLPPEIQEGLKKGIISKTQARTILGLKEVSQQKELFYKIIKERLSVREIEEKVRRKKKKPKASPFISEIEKKMMQALGTKVRVFHRKNNQGKIIIEYYNLDDLERITKRIL